MSERECFTVVFHLDIKVGATGALFGPAPPDGLSEEASKRWSIMNGFFPPVLTAILAALGDLGLGEFLVDNFQVAPGRLSVAIAAQKESD